MKKLLTALSLLFFLNSHGQIDTLKSHKDQKGFLFLTAYNYQYDYIEGQEMRPLGFHDFFFPTDSFDLKKLQDSCKKIEFNNGIRIDFIKNRKPLKEMAFVLNCSDTSGCYGFGKLYVLPVTIDYDIIQEYEPLVCRRNYFDIKIEKGSSIHFMYLHKAIKPSKIIIQSKVKQRKGKARVKRKR